jgi:ATP-dependent DNA helicase RecG
MDILNLLKQPESKTLEFKQDLSSPMGVLRTLIAFANTAGGTLIIGVEDKTKHICGITEPLILEEKLANLISDHITPQLVPEIEVANWRNQYLLILQISPSAIRPHYLKRNGPEKGSYIRVGSSNRLADQILLSELKRLKLEDSFDKQAMSALNSEEIDFRAVSESFENFKTLKLSDLESLDLLTTYQGKKVPTTAGIILFGKNRLKYFPDAWIQVGRFIGLTKTNIMDSQEIKTNPIISIDEALNFVKKHAMRALDIKGSRHTEQWSIPLTAIREALINAVVHADYAQQGAPIRLAIFDNRIEIENPGLLLFGLTIEDIKGSISKLRNRVIGQIFHRLGLIERWGSGIQRILDFCSAAGFAEPIFEEIGTHFRVTIFTQKNKVPHLNTTNQAIIAVLKNAEGLSTKDIAKLVHKSERTVRLRLIELIAQGLAIEIGQSITDPKRQYFGTTPI